MNKEYDDPNWSQGALLASNGGVGYSGIWINAKERMPEKDGRYLVSEDSSYTWIGVATMRQGEFDIPITHWMPLPQPPIQEKRNE